MVRKRSIVKTDLETSDDISEKEDEDLNDYSHYEGWQEAYEMFGPFVTLLSNTLHEARDPADQAYYRQQAKE